MKESVTVKELMQNTTHQPNGDFMPNMSLAILRKDPIVEEWLACYPKTTQTTIFQT